MVVIMVIVGAVVIGLIVAFLKYKKIGIFAGGISLNYKLLLNTFKKYHVAICWLKSCR